jgi:hypothetical protein
MKQLLFSLFILLGSLHAVSIKSRLFSQVQIMEEQLSLILKNEGLQSVSWQGNYQGFDRASFSYYKTIQLFHKLNKYRLKKSYGAIAIPDFPSQKISEEELYDLFKLFSRQLTIISGKASPFRYHPPKSYNQLYRRLSGIQDKLNLLNGLDGGTPTNVYNDASEILASIKALRTIQLQTAELLMPKKKSEQLPNDSLQAARELLQTIERSKKNLWMSKTSIPEIPKRSIRPDDVRSSLAKVKMELEQIKQHLGLEYSNKPAQDQSIKTSSDVVQILEYAKLMMPKFSLNTPLVQNPQTTLAQNYAKALSIAHFIKANLNEEETINYDYKSFKDLPTLQMDNYYFLLEESFVYIAKLRKKLGMKDTAKPVLPRTLTMKAITRLIIRLEQELSIINAKTDNETAVWSSDFSDDKQVLHSDLTTVLYQINSNIKKRYKLSLSHYDLYAASYIIDKQLQDLANYVGKPKKSIPLEIKDMSHQLIDFTLVKLQKQLIFLQTRANISVKKIQAPLDKTLTINALYHSLSQVKIVLRHILLALDINTRYPVAPYRSYSLQSIYTKLSQAEATLSKLLETH